MPEPLRRSMRPMAAEFIDKLVEAAPGKESLVVSEAVAAIEEEAKSRGYGEQRLLTPERRVRVMYRIIGRETADFRMLDIGAADREFRKVLQYHQPYDGYTDTALVAVAEFLAITY